MEEEKNGERLLFDDAPGHFYISNTHRTTSLSRRAEARRNHRNFAHGHYVFSDHQSRLGDQLRIFRTVDQALKRPGVQVSGVERK